MPISALSVIPTRRARMPITWRCPSDAPRPCAAPLLQRAFQAISSRLRTTGRTIRSYRRHVESPSSATDASRSPFADFCRRHPTAQGRGASSARYRNPHRYAFELQVEFLAPGSAAIPFLTRPEPIVRFVHKGDDAAPRPARLPQKRGSHPSGRAWCGADGGLHHGVTIAGGPTRRKSPAGG